VGGGRRGPHKKPSRGNGPPSKHRVGEARQAELTGRCRDSHQRGFNKSWGQRKSDSRKKAGRNEEGGSQGAQRDRNQGLPHSDKRRQVENERRCAMASPAQIGANRTRVKKQKQPQGTKKPTMNKKVKEGKKIFTNAGAPGCGQARRGAGGQLGRGNDRRYR